MTVELGENSVFEVVLSVSHESFKIVGFVFQFFQAFAHSVFVEKDEDWLGGHDDSADEEGRDCFGPDTQGWG